MLKKEMPETTIPINDYVYLTEQYDRIRIKKTRYADKTAKVKLADVMDDIDDYIKEKIEMELLRKTI